MCIGFGNNETPWTNTAFLDLIGRSSCALKSLQFLYVFESDDDVLECIEQIPSLECVRILVLSWQDRVVTDHLLGFLTVAEDDDGLSASYALPNMKKLTLEGTVSCSEEALSAMIRSRWELTNTSGRVARLEEVTLRVNGFVLSDPFLGLEDCIQEGLLLRLDDDCDPTEVDSSLSAEDSDSSSGSSN
ncbi:hypothetical protein JAAARDRAFT_531828 [Jaapia argillacea MUCL 33604]|uniref:Uncharacterized protein n=1 Tax=Jaapia argillacea MUCL 33604 TaxID=933084 RepID=A0A067PJY8_9AGAM|nr:hypothetical protein JAAARDRAFT_531828 [Jaapia argillacea MUCL 33604]